MDNYFKNLIVVDDNDKITGSAIALTAHIKETAVQHRAFSIFLFIKKNDELFLVLQKRSSKKFVFPNLWSNTVCSHPFLNKLSFTDPVLDCKQHGVERLKYELGLDNGMLNINDLVLVERLVYRADSDDSFKGKLIGKNNILPTIPDENILKESKSKDQVDINNFLKEKEAIEFVEREVDYIFVCIKNENEIVFNLNPDEVSEVKSVTNKELNDVLSSKDVSPWFKIIGSYLDIFSYVEKKDYKLKH